MSNEEALMHFLNHGFGEHRLANAASTRESMLSLIPKDQPALEIGPWGSPGLHGPQVRYADFFSTDELKEKAPGLWLRSGEEPPIHYVLGKITLRQIEERFTSVYSSHCIEHQPDLVDHLHGHPANAVRDRCGVVNAQLATTVRSECSVLRSACAASTSAIVVSGRK